ncbi:uncharacterized protein LOC119311447 [Triticum dicoccoides]|uniref:uncharacterized protein LOC119311447 n=1 Tax=Triticum dicoccoides TaxID=85692 RepID=UPI000E7A57E6|nr:uncharacterized protein LOC119311447 [Triticum dicoccoides]
MPGRSMEPAVWPPCDFHLADWSMSMEPTGGAWVPDEFASSTEMLGTCFQTYVPSSSSGGQLQQAQYAAATPNLPFQEEEEAQNKTGIEIHDPDPIQVFEEAAHQFAVDVGSFDMKMHRYPAIIKRLGSWYTTPQRVSIGPYYYMQDDLRPTEKMKHVAAYHCIMSSRLSVQELYSAVVSVANETRRLYDDDKMANMGDDDFLPMMFYDACFLVQYMLSYTRSDMDPVLCDYFHSNESDISHDIMLLENQIPWRVVKTLLSFIGVPLAEFLTSFKRSLRNYRVPERYLVDLDDSYTPPHFLGLVRFYFVGKSEAKRTGPTQTQSILASARAMELAEIGIRLTAKDETELTHIRLKKKGCLFAELSLAPLSLDSAHACYLVNMAALELCTYLAGWVEDEDSAVCSYLLLLGMFVDRVEDVDKLRTQRVLQGGGGLTNTDMLAFFANFHDLPEGRYYVHTMRAIQGYMDTRWKRTRSHAFLYNNWRIIAGVFSAIGALVGIVGTLMSLKKP